MKASQLSGFLKSFAQALSMFRELFRALEKRRATGYEKEDNDDAKLSVVLHWNSDRPATEPDGSTGELLKRIITTTFLNSFDTYRSEKVKRSRGLNSPCYT